MSVFGWDLPPGCSHSDIDRYYGWDDYAPIHCPTCGCFVSEKPIRTYQQNYERECDGKLTQVEISYDETLIRILGEEYRGKSYTETYPPVCVLSEFPGEKEHPPHKFVVETSTFEVRYCKHCQKEFELAV